MRSKLLGVTYHTAVIAAERKSDSKLTKDNPICRPKGQAIGCLL